MGSWEEFFSPDSQGLNIFIHVCLRPKFEAIGRNSRKSGSRSMWWARLSSNPVDGRVMLAEGTWLFISEHSSPLPFEALLVMHFSTSEF